MNSGKRDVHVNIGQIRVGRSGETLKATLGSCVGIGFYWAERKIAALAHCLLPESVANVRDPLMRAKFVNHAIPSLMEILEMEKSDIPRINVFVIGGGNMMEQLARRNVQHVGLKNVESALAILKGFRFHVTKEDCGGDYGRQVLFNCDDGNVEVKILSAPSSEKKVG